MKNAETLKSIFTQCAYLPDGMYEWQNSIAMMLSCDPRDENIISVDQLVSNVTGQGKGKLFMNWLCAQADEHQLTLVMDVVPDQAKFTKRLYDFYKRCGFEDYDDGYDLCRMPQGCR